MPTGRSSTISTDAPRRASSYATAQPTTPAPTTMMSVGRSIAHQLNVVGDLAMSLRCERIHPLKSSEPREVAISGVQRRAVLDGDGRQRGIRHERPNGLPRLDQALQYFPVPLAWFENGDRGSG